MSAIKQVQTAVVAKTLAPTWDEAFEFKVPLSFQFVTNKARFWIEHFFYYESL